MYLKAAPSKLRLASPERRRFCEEKMVSNVALIVKVVCAVETMNVMLMYVKT